MEFYDVVRKRRSVRAFEQRPVDPALVDRLLDLARRAPSAGFSQGIDFVVLQHPESVARFWKLTEDPAIPSDPADLAVGPPVVVLALSDPGRYLDRYAEPDKIAFGLDTADAWPVRVWDTDTAMACMLLLLAAVDEGLGGWFFGVAHGETELRAARRARGPQPGRRRGARVRAAGRGSQGLGELPAASRALRDRAPRALVTGAAVLQRVRCLPRASPGDP